MPERDELDRIIDAELSRYAEPRAGLEQRILARIDAGVVRRPGLISRWQAWALVGAAAAILFVVTVPRLVHRQQGINSAIVTSPNHPATRTSENPVSKIHIPARPSPRSPDRSRSAVRVPGKTGRNENAHLPKLDVFPAPQPLSAQEQALVVLATAPSEAARENLIASQRALNAPLQISAIEIPPITTPDEGRK